MIISRDSMLTGKLHTMDLDVTQDQIDRWLSGELIQVAMPNLSAGEREFIKTGITPSEWEKEFS